MNSGISVMPLNYMRWSNLCLRPRGIYIVCDHYADVGGMANYQLYMSIDEQREALLAGGFIQVDQLLIKSELVMHRAL